MNLTKKIARKIERELGFTNGWSIENGKYTEICRNVSADVIKMVDNHRKKQLSRKKRNTSTENEE